VAILKDEGYGAGFEVKTGDDDFDAEMGEQLKLSTKELRAAINAENLTDQLFARVMRDRKKKHEALLEKIPGVSTS
jgi:hypothetical protein